jgi:hypothetical protein
MRVRSLSRAIPLIAASLIPAVKTAPLAAQPHTTIGGYGELHYVNPNRPGVGSVGTLKRFVLYFAHTFDDRITFRSELEVEDAKVEGGDEGGEVALEQAYLDFRLGDHATVRAGLVLIPLGIVNETHEPPTFNGVARADYHAVIIPTTWRELGVGVVGSVPGAQGLVYKAYLVNGLLADGFTAERGIRGGRQEGKEASFANPSLTGRLEYARPGLKIGGAVYYGGTANGDPRLGTGILAAPVTMLAADARFDRGPWAFRGEAAYTHLAKAAEIGEAFGEDVGSRMSGWYGEGAYNLLHLVRRSSTAQINAFLRYERLNTQAGVPDGVTADGAFARRITTLGLTWKPISSVAIKGDYQFRRNKAGAGEDEVVRLGVGYQF